MRIVRGIGVSDSDGSGVGAAAQAADIDRDRMGILTARGASASGIDTQPIGVIRQAVIENLAPAVFNL